MTGRSHPLTLLGEGASFPDGSLAWPEGSSAPGLLAIGGDLRVETLLQAYSSGVFPWFGDGQPILWWSPNQRMVLAPSNFRLHRSLRKAIQRFERSPTCQIRIDAAFDEVINACATANRPEQSGTWIQPSMIQAYQRLHRAGFAHSVETWIDGHLAGGLYCVALGAAVYGESMFSNQTNASKIALAALVCLCKRQGVHLIDCQQNTRHLASLGAAEIPRDEFVAHVSRSVSKAALPWIFSNDLWREIF